MVMNDNDYDDDDNDREPQLPPAPRIQPVVSTQPIDILPMHRFNDNNESPPRHILSHSASADSQSQSISDSLQSAHDGTDRVNASDTVDTIQPLNERDEVAQLRAQVNELKEHLATALRHLVDAQDRAAILMAQLSNERTTNHTNMHSLGDTFRTLGTFMDTEESRLTQNVMGSIGGYPRDVFVRRQDQAETAVDELVNMLVARDILGLPNYRR
ncbi:hypothetical protein GQ42DRAFT_164012 [Ramicandelaber brevisporus]|nr:hypothetical protein GQ42DRAFT_164012 [Ramicandelaber brevisporus]